MTNWIVSRINNERTKWSLNARREVSAPRLAVTPHQLHPHRPSNTNHVLPANFSDCGCLYWWAGLDQHQYQSPCHQMAAQLRADRLDDGRLRRGVSAKAARHRRARAENEQDLKFQNVESTM